MSPDDRLMTLKDAARMFLGDTKHAAYLKGELGLTLAGYRFADGSCFTKPDDIAAFQQRIRLVSETPIDKPGLYVVGFGHFVKIGMSATSVKYRAQTIQQGIPQRLRFFASLTGGIDEEKSLHRRFKKYRVRGEWFRMAGDVTAWINGGFR